MVNDTKLDKIFRSTLKEIVLFSNRMDDWGTIETWRENNNDILWTNNTLTMGVTVINIL